MPWNVNPHGRPVPIRYLMLLLERCLAGRSALVSNYVAVKTTLALPLVSCWIKVASTRAASERAPVIIVLDQQVSGRR